MSEHLEVVRDFTRQVEKTLRTRRLYAPNSITYTEATERLLEKLQLSLEEDRFTLRVTAADLWLGKHTIFTCEDRDDSFFFPLFRDGLRELRFAPGVDLEEIERLLEVFESEKKSRLSTSLDTVSELWRADLSSITFTALDGIDDEEGGDDALPGSDQDDYRYLISDLSSKIKNPAPAETGQGYSFVLDAGVKVSATDLHYEAGTSRRAFEDNPNIIGLSSAEVHALRHEVEGQDEAELLERFVEILFVLLNDPSRPVSMSSLSPIFQRLLEGYWAADEHGAMVAGIARLHEAAQEAPNRDNRAAAADIINRFLDQEHMEASYDRVRDKTLSTAHAFALWRVAGNAHWLGIVGVWAGIQDDDLKPQLSAFLKESIKADPDLLRPMLTSPDLALIRGGLALLDRTFEGLYEDEILGLLGHQDEHIRIKGLSAAGRIASSKTKAAIWKAMEADPANAVRLLAFRIVGEIKDPDVSKRLQAVVSSSDFHDRPTFEREKYVKLLAKVDGAAATRIFTSWIPSKRWLWNKKDHATTRMALNGLLAAGKAGKEAFTQVAQGKDKAAKVAVELYQELRAERDRKSERSASS